MGKRVVLSVEADDAAFKLLQTAFREAQPEVELLRAHDGEQALQFLHRASGHENAPRPDLILLNLDLPRKSGLEVLAGIAANESLRVIPVTIFTTSGLYREAAEARALGAHNFLAKPTSFSSLVEAVNSAWARVASAG